MNIFEDIFFVLILAVVLLLPLGWWRIRARLKYLQKMARTNVLRRQQKMDGSQIYSSWIIDKSVKYLYFRRHKKAKKALAKLTGGRVNEAVDILRTKNGLLADLLLAHHCLAKSFTNLKKRKQIPYFQYHYAALRPLVAWQMFGVEQAQVWLEQMQQRKLHQIARAYNDYMQTHLCINSGDMQNAVQHLQRALKFFKKRGYVAEEAACYIKLAEIYRLCCMNDTAETMLDAAIKIYRLQGAVLHLSAAIASKGMLMLFEGRNEEAEAYYEQALLLAPTEKMQADIINQQALLELTSGKIDVALKKVRKTHRFYEKMHHNIGLAFCLQLEGQIFYEKMNYSKAVSSLQKAAELYLQQRNYTAYAESGYSTANALCKINKFAQAEKLSKQILNVLKKHKSGFHVANVYSLLGLINMENNNLSVAEKWLQKSLTLEQQSNRYTGAAADAVNLAITQQLRGNIEQAHTYSKQALEFAKKTEDNEFIELIKSKILH